MSDATKPRKSTPLTKTTREGWFYTNPNSLDVVVEVQNAQGTYLGTGQVRIYRRQLKAWAAAQEKPEPETDTRTLLGADVVQVLKTKEALAAKEKP